MAIGQQTHPAGASWVGSLHRVEACFWMLRQSSFSLALIVPPAWLAAAEPPGVPRFVAMMLAVAVFGGFAQVVNDILDHERDAVTAPYLPLPSGLVTLPQAIATAVVTGSGVIAFAALASADLRRFLLGVAAFTVVTVILLGYSWLKRFAVLGPVTHAVMTTVIATGAWLVAGGGDPRVALSALAFVFLFGVASNVHSGLRDVDGDGVVGNRTIAVRFGARNTLLLVVALDVACMVLALIIAVGERTLWVTAGVVVVALAWRAAALFRVLPGISAAGLTRVERLAGLKNAALSRMATQVSATVAFSLVTAIVVTAVTVALLVVLMRAYEQRIVRGGLARELSAS